MKEHKNRSRRKYKFTDKRQSVGGIFSTMLGIMAVSFFLAAIFISYRQKGNGGREIGFLGIMSLFLSSIGLYIGTNSFQEENVFYLFISDFSVFCQITTFTKQIFCIMLKLCTR